MECKKIEANGQYALKGSFGDIPVEGDGDITVTTGKYFLLHVDNVHCLYNDKTLSDFE